MSRLILMLVAVTIALARASVVTQCATDSQFRSAVAAGGLVTFACGTATITSTGLIDITRDTEIDGYNQITLDAANARLFRVTVAGVHFRLAGLTMRHGNLPGGLFSGSILISINPSTITISGSRIEDSYDPLSFSGADLTIEKTTIANNASTFLGANNGTVTIVDSEIFGNRGAVLSSCVLNISRTRFTNNQSQNGGAINSGCKTTIDHSDFVNNSATADGGALWFDKSAISMALRACRFTGNTAGGLGGAIAMESSLSPARTLQIRYGEFGSNRASRGGAIHLGDAIENNTTLDAALISFNGNTATQYGGGISGANAAVVIRRGVFLGNHATRGGAIFLQLYAPRPSVIVNTILARNTASMTGSALSASDVQVINSTIAENQGTAIAFSLDMSPAAWRDIAFTNTVIWSNTGGNCAAPGVPGVRYEDRGHNLQYPLNDCGAAIPATPPLLDPAYDPLPGGPAFAQGDNTACLAPEVGSQDVWGQRRPRMGRCSIGAVEGEMTNRIERKFKKRDR